MGYRSYGQLIFPTSQMDAYHRLAGGHKDNSLDMWDEQETIDLKYTEPWYQSKYIQDNDSLTVLDFSGWKWYESYPDIQAIESFMQYLEDEGHVWFYWRKGEDATDITIIQGYRDDVPFELGEGYSEMAWIDSLHGQESYERDEIVYYYSLHIEDDGGTTKKTWNKQIKKLKEFIEKKLKLELTTWEDVHPNSKVHLLYAKIDAYGEFGNSQIKLNDSTGKLREYLDTAEIGGSDTQWHLFLTTKEEGATNIEIETIHGTHSPWDYDIYLTVDVGWAWSPQKAKPPKSINYRNIWA